MSSRIEVESWRRPSVCNSISLLRAFARRSLLGPLLKPHCAYVECFLVPFTILLSPTFPATFSGCWSSEEDFTLRSIFDFTLVGISGTFAVGNWLLSENSELRELPFSLAKKTKSAKSSKKKEEVPNYPMWTHLSLFFLFFCNFMIKVLIGLLVTLKGNASTVKKF